MKLLFSLSIQKCKMSFAPTGNNASTTSVTSATPLAFEKHTLMIQIATKSVEIIEH